jgi:hypothetical protein
MDDRLMMGEEEEPLVSALPSVVDLAYFHVQRCWGNTMVVVHGDVTLLVSELRAPSVQLVDEEADCYC